MEIKIYQAFMLLVNSCEFNGKDKERCWPGIGNAVNNVTINLESGVN